MRVAAHKPVRLRAWVGTIVFLGLALAWGNRHDGFTGATLRFDRKRLAGS
jgi:hypothetical protein